MATTKIRCTEKTESPKGTAESSQEGAEKRGRRILGGRGKDSFEWVAGHPVTRRDPSDRKSAEQLGGRAWLKVRQVARRALSIQKGID